MRSRHERESGGLIKILSSFGRQTPGTVRKQVQTGAHVKVPSSTVQVFLYHSGPQWSICVLLTGKSTDLQTPACLALCLQHPARNNNNPFIAFAKIDVFMELLHVRSWSQGRQAGGSRTTNVSALCDVTKEGLISPAGRTILSSPVVVFF